MFFAKTLSLIIPSAFCNEAQGQALAANLHNISHLFTEIVCVDYLSSPCFIQALSRLSNLRVIFQSTPTGIYGAWVLGLSSVSSTHICFAGVDDILHKVFIESFLSYSEKPPFTTIFYGDKLLSKGSKEYFIPSPPRSSLKNYYVQCDIPIPGLIFPIFSTDYIDTRFRLAADMNLLLLLIRQASFKLQYLNLLQVNQKFHGLSNSDQAVSIYLAEWRLLETLYHVRVNNYKKWYFYIMLLAQKLRLFTLLQSLKSYVRF